MEKAPQRGRFLARKCKQWSKAPPPHYLWAQRPPQRKQKGRPGPRASDLVTSGCPQKSKGQDILRGKEVRWQWPPKMTKKRPKTTKNDQNRPARYQKKILRVIYGRLAGGMTHPKQIPRGFYGDGGEGEGLYKIHLSLTAFTSERRAESTSSTPRQGHAKRPVGKASLLLSTAQRTWMGLASSTGLRKRAFFSQGWAVAGHRSWSTVSVTIKPTPLIDPTSVFLSVAFLTIWILFFCKPCSVSERSGLLSVLPLLSVLLLTQQDLARQRVCPYQGETLTSFGHELK